MDENTLTGIRTLLELGWPAIVTLFLVAIYRKLDQFQQRQSEAYFKLQEDYIEHLKSLMPRYSAGGPDWPLRPPLPPPVPPPNT